MSTGVTTPPRVPRPPLYDPRRTRQETGRRQIPSWVISLVLHLVVLLLLSQSDWSPKGVRGSGNSGEAFTIIAGHWDGGLAGLPGDGNGQTAGPGTGMFTGGGESASESETGVDADVAAGRTEKSGAAGDDNGTRPNRSVAGNGVNQPPSALDEGPPVELDLPGVPEAVNARVASVRSVQGSGETGVKNRQAKLSGGNGRGRGTGTGDGIGNGVQGGGGQGGQGGGRGGTGTGGGGGTSFFGHQAVGKRFVYVLDASGSMYDYNAIAVAKSELLASLSQLDQNEQFQVIFYNERCYSMKGAGGKDELFWGTEVNRTLASQFIRNVEPDGGTRHVDALMLALSYSPDVVFFLTDAGEPYLYAADLDQIKRRNGGRATIYTVEFGKGPSLKTDNFLKKLARDNQGAHAYRDVQQFQK
ncbi:MAG: hypothetical protein JSS02_19055 [Planctomycetes bacterium]|nr:hypothetical protein [Planctomycetota bacterium]